MQIGFCVFLIIINSNGNFISFFMLAVCPVDMVHACKPYMIFASEV